jgi:hypothetical protein
LFSSWTDSVCSVTRSPQGHALSVGGADGRAGQAGPA